MEVERHVLRSMDIYGLFMGESTNEEARNVREKRDGKAFNMHIRDIEGVTAWVSTPRRIHDTRI